MFKKQNIFMITTLVFVVIGALLFAGSMRYITRTQPSPAIPQVQKNSSAYPNTSQLENNQLPSNIPSIVNSSTTGVVGISVLRPSTFSIFQGKTPEEWGIGSGVIVSSNGYILTNNHVAGGKTKKIVISLANGKNVNGSTLWSDSILDLAIVKIDESNLNALPLGNSDTLQVGETALAIGNPFGLEFQRTVTSGIISALNRTIQINTDQGTNYMEDLIQTDASINPGNSGGPLLNYKGEVIGINTIKVKSAEGIGFAIPINAALPIVKKYIDNTNNSANLQFNQTYMGVFAFSKDAARYLSKDTKIDNGIYVSYVDENSPAFKEGIRVGCNIIKVDGKPINTMMQLRSYIHSKNPGDVIKVTHISKGKQEITPITLVGKEKDGLITR